MLVERGSWRVGDGEMMRFKEERGGKRSEVGDEV